MDLILKILVIFSLTTTTFTQVPSSGCDLITNENKCFSYFSHSGINWVDARANCQTWGGDLASIANAGENAAVDSIRTPNASGFCWIGLNDNETEDTFVWSDGSNSSYTNWKDPQPDDYSGEDCTQLIPIVWNDLPCNDILSCYYCSLLNANLFGRTVNASTFEELNNNTILSQDTTLYCVTENRNTPLVTWSYVNLDGIRSFPIGATNDTTGVSLLEVTSDNPGIYSCQATRNGTIITYVAEMLVVPDPDVPPFDPDDVVDAPAGPTRLNLTIPTISESILDGLIGYRCVYQGFLSKESLNAPSRKRRRRRSSSDVIVAMTDVQTQTFLDNSQTLTLNNILPNYCYEVNVFAINLLGETPSVLINPTPLPAIAPSGPPINIKLTALSATKIQIDWANNFTTLNGPLVRFDVAYRVSDEASPTTKAIIPTDVVGPFSDTITNLLPNEEYIVTIAVVNTVSQGPSSNELRARTQLNKIMLIQETSENENATFEETIQAIKRLQILSNDSNAEASSTFEASVNASLLLIKKLEMFSSNLSDESISLIVSTLSNLIGIQEIHKTNTFAAEQNGTVEVYASKLISGIEIVGIILPTLLKGNVTELVFRSERLDLIAQIITNTNNINGELTIPKLDNFTAFESVVIPESVLGDLSSGGEFKYSLAFISVVSNTSNPTGHYSLRSRLLSLIVSTNSSTMTNTLTTPIRLHFSTPNNNNQEAKCVFLDIQNSIFRSDGLNLKSSEGNVTVCESIHLTSFGALIRIKNQTIEGGEKLALSITSYILLSSSLIALILSILIFIVLRKEFFRVEMNRIYFNYALSLALAIFIFIFGIQLSLLNSIVCSVTVFLLHYFWLAVFSWSLCVSIEIIYLLWITSLDRKNLFWFLLSLGWGLPVPIVVISIAVRHDSYRSSTADFCFLSYSNGLIWSFIGPILVLLCFNLIALFMACIKIVLVAKNRDKHKNITNWEVTKQSVINSSFLFPVLGAPWIVLPISLLATPSDSTTLFEWTFIILNCPSGILFFILFTLRHNIVREKLFRRKPKASDQYSNELSSIPKYKLARVTRPKYDNISFQTCESDVGGVSSFDTRPSDTTQTTENNSNIISKELSKKCLNSDVSDGISETAI